MSQLNVVRRCYNCGTILQSDDPKKPGFVDKTLLESSQSAVLFCEKCWKEQRYNIAPREPTVDPQFLSMLNDAQASDATIVYVVDLFSFEASFIIPITQAIEGLHVLVIANKRDLLPRKMSDALLREYVAHRFRVARLSVTADDVVLTSLTSSADIKAIADRIETLRRRHDVYIIGAINAGKTLFLSSFLRSYSNASRFNITTANYPGTTIRVMQIPLDSSSMIYDTPGTSLDNSIVSHLDVEAARAVTPHSEVEPRKMMLNQGDACFIGGLARIDLIKGNKQLIQGYFSEDVSFKKSTRHPDEGFIKGIERGNLYPCSKSATALNAFDAFDIVVDEVGPRDIGIEGLGWINFKGDNQTFRVYVPKGVSVYTTRAKIKKC
jgi:ribosome biogenesis GTPase A